MLVLEKAVRQEVRVGPKSLSELLALALILGARDVPEWTTEEDRLIRELPLALPLFVSDILEAILAGEDPLGDAFCSLFSSDERRPMGATYTPQPVVEAMLAWAATQLTPIRVVDPGAGSARFLIAAGRRFPEAELIASELDPTAALIARGNLAAAGFANRSRVVVGDYRNLSVPPIDGPTLYLGNPPYVRHHLIDPVWKNWLVRTAGQYGSRASQLAGLHVHFFLATAEHARAGDVGVLITAAEWLDVNYGRLVRELLTGVLGAKTLNVIEPTAEPFPGTQSTAVITGFAIGEKPVEVGVRRIASLSQLGHLQTGRSVPRAQLAAADRWTPLTRSVRHRREGFVELGELCRVHRGQVTGANAVWIAGDNATGLPESVLFPAVTRAKELFAAGDILADPSHLRRVIDLPVELDSFESSDRRRIDAFLRFAKAKGADSGFVARHRKAWWSVGLREPAPILATYLARRPPVFVRNLAGARHINIAHGLYPREELSNHQLANLASYLSQQICVTEGRTYAGGLTKFEPKEMERLLVPRPELLTEDEYIEASA